MNLGDELRAVLHQEAAVQNASRPDVDRLISGGRVRRRRGNMARFGVAAAVVAVFVGGGVYGAVQIDSGTALEPTQPSPGPTQSTASEPIDTSSWTTYTSDRYDLRVGHPPDWTEVPATRDWRSDTKVEDWQSPAHEVFVAPSGDVRVSVWNVPLDVAAPTQCVDLQDRAFRMCVESVDYLEAWVEDYCEASGNTPCTTIDISSLALNGERDPGPAVELCLERWDCHPGLLVPFESDVQAFFSGGIYDADAMTVVAVWRGESDPFVARYGGARRLLEGFLSTMEVWTAATQVEERR